MTHERKQPYLWVTWLSKIMGGEKACLWAAWFKAHFQGFPTTSDFDLVRWNIEPTRLLTATRIELARQHTELRVEDGNAFRYQHESGAIIAGRPDRVAIENRTATVLDCKTGKPRPSDQIQVQLGMFFLPRCFPELNRFTWHGVVVYADHRVEIPSTAVDERFQEHLNYFVRLIAGQGPPMKAPSTGECRFCDITAADCPDRIQLGRLTKAAI